jgi:hypothetical protein
MMLRGGIGCAALAALIACALAPVAFARTRHAHHRRSPRTCPHARLAQVTVSPLPGTLDASPGTQISFLGVSGTELRSVSVIGTRTGVHHGVLRSYDSQSGASFVPTAGFAPGERVSVCASVRTAGGRRLVGASFTVATPAHVRYQTPFEVPGTRGEMQTYHSVDIKPPRITTLQGAGSGSAFGDILATPYAGPGEHGAMIFESSGRLIWFHRPPEPNWGIADLRVQSYEGHQDLVFWQGEINTLGFGVGEDVILNSAYEQVAAIHGGNGLAADLHEAQLIEGEHGEAALITAYEPVRVSVPATGPKAHAVSGGGAILRPAGRRTVTVIDSAVQEIDVRTGLVMWEWHGLGRVPISETHVRLPEKGSGGAGPLDYLHVDSLQQLAGGKLLVSARNAWAVYAVSEHTGRVIWRLGGRHSSFAVAGGPTLSWPEGATMPAAEQVALIDGGSGSGPGSAPAAGTGEALDLSFPTKAASLASSGQLRVPRTGSARGAGQGSMQALPNGAWMVGLGSLPDFAEFGPTGEVLYAARFPAGEVGYRVYRASWSGQPAAAPNVVATTSGTTTNVYMSWNGATDVAAWSVLAGPAPAALAPVGQAADAGFETAVTMPAASYVRVQALGPAGEVLSESKTNATGHQ